MTASGGTRTLVIEKELRHPPAKVWRALTETALLDEWLLKNDFKPVVGHRFTFRRDPIGDWDGVVHCEVLEVVPLKRLSYGWRPWSEADWTVTWVLEPTATGTKLRMEQAGFRPDQNQAYAGARYGMDVFLSQLDVLLGRLT